MDGDARNAGTDGGPAVTGTTLPVSNPTAALNLALDWTLEAVMTAPHPTVRAQVVRTLVQEMCAIYSAAGPDPDDIPVLQRLLDAADALVTRRSESSPTDSSASSTAA